MWALKSYMRGWVWGIPIQWKSHELWCYRTKQHDSPCPLQLCFPLQETVWVRGYILGRNFISIPVVLDWNIIVQTGEPPAPPPPPLQRHKHTITLHTLHPPTHPPCYRAPAGAPVRRCVLPCSSGVSAREHSHQTCTNLSAQSGSAETHIQ